MWPLRYSYTKMCSYKFMNIFIYHTNTHDSKPVKEMPLFDKKDMQPKYQIVRNVSSFF